VTGPTIACNKSWTTADPAWLSARSDRTIFPIAKGIPMGARAVDFMDRWIAENITEDFYGPGDAEVPAEKLKADAADAGFDPEVIEYETGKAVLTLIREATEKHSGAVTHRTKSVR
jgi:hypothetical protein